MTQSGKFHGNIRHYCKNGLCLAILVSLALAATSIAGAAEPSGTEIYQAMMQKQYPQFDQFQLGLNAKWMGESVLTAILGWDGGAAFTASASSPMIPGGITAQAALRPSGFAYYKLGNIEEVSAELVPYAAWLEVLPAIMNRDLLLKLTDVYDIEYSGETEIAGRPAYILDLTVNLDMFSEQLKDVFITIAQEPIIAMALYQEDIFVEEVVSRWDEFAAEIMAEIGEQETATQRIYVDKQDYLMLGMDMSAMQKFYQDDLEENYPAAAAMDFTIFEYELEEVKVDANGHIAELSWMFHLAVPVMPEELETDAQDIKTENAGINSPADQLAFSLDMSYVETVMGGQLLPIYIGADITIDPALLAQYGPSETDLNLSERQNFQCSLELKWDLERGADHSLLENKNLVNAENYWQNGLLAYQVGDYKTAVKLLGQLTRIAPTFVNARSVLSDAYHATGEIMAAISELEQVLMLEPYDLHALNNLAYYYVDYDIDPGRGLELALEAYDWMYFDPSVVDTLAWAYYKNEMLPEAAQTMQECLELCSFVECNAGDLAILHYHMGVIYAAQELWAAAAEQLELVLKIDPEYDDAAELLDEVRSKQVD